MSCMSCFGCFSSVPPDHTELSRDELKALYQKSISLNGGRLIVHGIFARANTKNNNKRVYPKYVLKREVEKFARDHISKGTALGELDHPNYASRYFKCINLPNVSHQVLDVKWKGDQLWGSIEILPTPSGLLLWELYSQGIKLGVSSRGWASLRTDPNQKCVYVDDDFELITFDFVTEPSTRGAFLVPIWKTYRRPVPPQARSVQLTHMGHGVCTLEHVPKLPQMKLLAARISELQAEAHTDAGVAGQSEACRASKLAYLDKLLLYSHYIVFQDAQYLDREKHARDFHSHLAMFATRAHLSSQAQSMTRADLNALIIEEMAKEEAVDCEAAAKAMRLSQSIGNICVPSDDDEDCSIKVQQGAGQRATDAECQGQLADDTQLRPWALQPTQDGSSVAMQAAAAAAAAASDANHGPGGDGCVGNSSKVSCSSSTQGGHADGSVTEQHAAGMHPDLYVLQNGQGGDSCISTAGLALTTVTDAAAGARVGGQGGRPFLHQLGSGNRTRVHPTPTRNVQQQLAQQQQQGQGQQVAGPSCEVLLEFDRIRATLSSFAAKRLDRHQAVQDALNVVLPPVATHIDLRGASPVGPAH